MLGPKNLLRPETVDHGDKDADPDSDEYDGHDSSADLDALALEYIAHYFRGGNLQ